MPSSTSSSDVTVGDTAARAGWRALGLGFSLFVAGVAAIELIWRALGVAPSVLDSRDQWCVQRDRVYGDDAVVFLGGSRAMFDIDAVALEERLPGARMVMLSIGATYGAAVLRDLANDPEFRGVVIASMRGEAFETTHFDSQQDYVDYYHHDWRVEKKIASLAMTQLASRLAILSPSVSLRRLVEDRLEGQAFNSAWLRFRADRTIDADFAKHPPGDGTALKWIMKKHYGDARISKPRAWLVAAAALEGWIDAIQARGGRVALVRFPTAGVYWQYDERFYPRARYWDRFAAQTSAVTLHFRDVPELRGFELPDRSHVDGSDSAAFTRALLDALAARGLFAGRSYDGT